MSDEIKPKWEDGLPLCTGKCCPQFYEGVFGGGHNCGLTDRQTDTFCEPALVQMRDTLARERAAREAAERDRDAARAETLAVIRELSDVSRRLGQTQASLDAARRRCAELEAAARRVAHWDLAHHEECPVSQCGDCDDDEPCPQHICDGPRQCTHAAVGVLREVLADDTPSGRVEGMY